jgi:glucose/arabinose dehydrogenase
MSVHVVGRRLLAVVCASAAVALVCRHSSTTLLAQPTITTVMAGLDNPRGLAFAPEGSLYVVEAGRGGDFCFDLRGMLMCSGASGALTRLRLGIQERVAVGFPSYISPRGEVTGAHDVAFLGTGGAYVTIGFGGDPERRAASGFDGAMFGALLHVAASGEWRAVADVAAHEATYNPSGGPIDTNPYGLLAEPGARMVTDAGANALLRVAADGTITTTAVFPSRPQRATDAVPTAVVSGPDGAYYVSELTGAPFAPGAANIYRVLPGQTPEVYLSGFRTAIDLAFAPDGSLYVLEFAKGTGSFFSSPGDIVRIDPDGTRTVVIDNLANPTSLAVGPDEALYVTNRGLAIGQGEVLRIPR